MISISVRINVQGVGFNLILLQEAILPPVARINIKPLEIWPQTMSALVGVTYKEQNSILRRRRFKVHPKQDGIVNRLSALIITELKLRPSAMSMHSQTNTLGTHLITVTLPQSLHLIKQIQQDHAL